MTEFEVLTPLDEIERLEQKIVRITAERDAARNSYRDLCRKIEHIKELVRS